MKCSKDEVLEGHGGDEGREVVADREGDAGREVLEGDEGRGVLEGRECDEGFEDRGGDECREVLEGRGEDEAADVVEVRSARTPRVVAWSARRPRVGREGLPHQGPQGTGHPPPGVLQEPRPREDQVDLARDGTVKTFATPDTGAMMVL